MLKILRQKEKWISLRCVRNRLYIIKVVKEWNNSSSLSKLSVDIPLEGDCRDDCNCMTVNGVCTTIPGGKKVCRCAAGNTDNGNGVCALSK